MIVNCRLLLSLQTVMIGPSTQSVLRNTFVFETFNVSVLLNTFVFRAFNTSVLYNTTCCEFPINWFFQRHCIQTSLSIGSVITHCIVTFHLIASQENICIANFRPIVSAKHDVFAKSDTSVGEKTLCLDNPTRCKFKTCLFFLKFEQSAAQITLCFLKYNQSGGQNTLSFSNSTYRQAKKHCVFQNRRVGRQKTPRVFENQCVGSSKHVVFSRFDASDCPNTSCFHDPIDRKGSNIVCF